LGAAAVGAALMIAKVPAIDVFSLALLLLWSVMTVVMIKAVTSKGSDVATALGEEYDLESSADETFGAEIASQVYQVI
jgi:hypothetical protein